MSSDLERAAQICDELAEQFTSERQLVAELCAAKIRDLSPTQPDGWVSVSDRLPGDGIAVLVYRPPRGYDEGGIGFDCRYEGGWQQHDDSYEHYCAVGRGLEGAVGPSQDAPYTYWHHLPPPPAEGEQSMAAGQGGSTPIRNSTVEPAPAAPAPFLGGRWMNGAFYESSPPPSPFNLGTDLRCCKCNSWVTRDYKCSEPDCPIAERPSDHLQSELARLTKIFNDRYNGLGIEQWYQSATVAERELAELDKELAEARQAIGLLTTATPDVVMRPDDLIGMAQEMVAKLSAALAGAKP